MFITQIIFISMKLFVGISLVVMLSGPQRAVPSIWGSHHVGIGWCVQLLAGLKLVENLG